MSAEDKDNKTHEPTAKRLDDARRKGEVAVAPEMRHAVMLLGIWALGGTLGVTALAGLLRMSMELWSGAGTLRIEAHAASAFAGGIMVEAARPVLPLVGGLLGFALLIGFAQGRPTAARARLKPKWSRLNPAASLARMFGKQGLVEFAKTVAKCAAVLAVCTAVRLWHGFGDHVCSDDGPHGQSRLPRSFA